jgi:hypothetical protein
MTRRYLWSFLARTTNSSNCDPKIRIYVFDSPKFAEIGKGTRTLDQYNPKDSEELGSLNVTIP